MCRRNITRRLWPTTTAHASRLRLHCLPARVAARQPEVGRRPPRDPVRVDLGCHVDAFGYHPLYRARQSIVERPSRGVAGLISQDLVLVRMLGTGFVFDELARGNHRRGRAGATPGGGANGAYRCAANGGGWGPGHTGNVGAARRRELSPHCERFSRRALTLDAPSGPLRGGAGV